MFIKTAGTYLAMCSQYCMIFRAVGDFPFFTVPTAIILNDFINGGNIREVKENDPEIQGLITAPYRYAIASLDAITDDGSFKNLDLESTGTVIFDEDDEKKYTEKLKYIDQPNSGISINSLIMDMVADYNVSIPQGRMMVCVLRKNIKDERTRKAL